MSSTRENCQADIVRLTKAAAEAAELGRWDTVAQCYHERGTLLAAIQAPVREASDLMKLDEQIRDRVRAVQAVVISLLDEAMATRKRLQGLYQRLGVQRSTPVAVSRKV